jgi:hypothetical protein
MLRYIPQKFYNPIEIDEETWASKHAKKSKKKSSNATNNSKSNKDNKEGGKDIEELRAKLHARIQQMRQKRKADENLNRGAVKRQRLEKQDREKPSLREEANEVLGSSRPGGKKKMEIVNENEETDLNAIQYGTFDFKSGKPMPSYLLAKNKKKNNLNKLLIKAENQKKLLEEIKGKEEEQVCGSFLPSKE